MYTYLFAKYSQKQIFHVSIIIPGLRYDFKSINLLNGISFITNIYISLYDQRLYWGRRGRDRMVVGFTTNNAIGAYRH